MKKLNKKELKEIIQNGHINLLAWFWLSVFLFSGAGSFHFFIHRTLVEQKKEE